MIPQIKHAPYKGSTKAILAQLQKPGDRFLADSEKQAVCLHTTATEHGIKLSRRRQSTGQYLVVRIN